MAISYSFFLLKVYSKFFKRPNENYNNILDKFTNFIHISLNEKKEREKQTQNKSIKTNLNEFLFRKILLKQKKNEILHRLEIGMEKK